MKIAELEALINQTKQSQPVAGRALALSQDLSILAGVYGAMIYWQVTDTDQLALNPAQQAVLVRLKPA